MNQRQKAWLAVAIALGVGYWFLRGSPQDACPPLPLLSAPDPPPPPNNPIEKSPNPLTWDQQRAEYEKEYARNQREYEERRARAEREREEHRVRVEWYNKYCRVLPESPYERVVRVRKEWAKDRKQRLKDPEYARTHSPWEYGGLAVYSARKYAQEPPGHGSRYGHPLRSALPTIREISDEDLLFVYNTELEHLRSMQQQIKGNIDLWQKMGQPHDMPQFQGIDMNDATRQSDQILDEIKRIERLKRQLLGEKTPEFKGSWTWH